MAVGLSDGTGYENNEEWLSSTTSTAPSVPSTMPLGASTEPAGALKSSGGTNPPAEVPNTRNTNPSKGPVTVNPWVTIGPEDIDQAINVGLAAGSGTMKSVGGTTESIISKLEEMWQQQQGPKPIPITESGKPNTFEQVPFGYTDEQWHSLLPQEKQEVLAAAKNPNGWDKPNVPLSSTHPASGFDYEQMGDGKFEVFDPLSGKTHGTTGTEEQAKNLVDTFNKYGPDIFKQTPFKPSDAPAGGTFSYDKYIDMFIKQPTMAKAEALPEKMTPKEAFLEGVKDVHDKLHATLANIQANLVAKIRGPISERIPKIEPTPEAKAAGYTEPAYRGLSMTKGGDVNPIYDPAKGAGELYSTSSPMLADMYSSYLSSHPGVRVPEGTFSANAQVQPLFINPSEYHYYDAQGAHWSSSAGNAKGIEQARALNKKGVIVDNVWDEPNGTKVLGGPKKVYITFPEGLSTVKSRFAQKFDASSPNMLQGVAAIGTGGTAGYVSTEQKDGPLGPKNAHRY